MARDMIGLPSADTIRQGALAPGGALGGDGSTDSIPAMIDGQEPAALSEGEYVLRAPVVAFLGGGSTDAGARSLDEFQDRIMQLIEEGGMEEPTEFVGEGDMGMGADLMGGLGALEGMV